jgi:arylsulfatase A-like enzyme
MQEVWRTIPVSAVRSGKYKLLEFLEDGHRELYDLENDPGETNNLAGKQPGKAGELFDLLQGWRSAMGVTYPLEKNPDFDAASIPARFKAGGRSDIYKPRFKKEK